MKKNILIVLGISTSIFAGCIPYVEPTYVPPQQQSPMPPPSPVREKTHVAEDSFSIESAVNTKMRIKIICSQSERSFCRKLAERLITSVFLENAELTLNDPCDAVVHLIPEFEEVDKDGGYFRIKCTQVTAQIKSDRKIYASTTVEPAPLRRKLGLDNAKNQYVNPVAKALAAYLKEELQRISNNDISVTEMRFALKNPRRTVDNIAISHQVERIHRILRSMPGVVNYTNVAQHTSQAAVTFRIVYLKDKYPQGIVNAVNAKLEIL